MGKTIKGFSKLNKTEKINWLTEAYFNGDNRFVKILSQYWNNDQQLQTLHDEFIENTITNFYLPLGIAPNFEIDGKTFAIPMAIEESSVVAAASNAAKFWQSRGGFKTSVISTKKLVKSILILMAHQKYFLLFLMKSRTHFWKRHQKSLKTWNVGVVALQQWN